MNAASLFEQFTKDLGADDETGLVIRTHAHIEGALRHYVECVVPFPQHLPKLTYAAVVRLACAVGFDENHLGALRGLGDLRNHFGHRHDAKLTDENVGKLLNSFETQERATVVASYEESRQAGKIRGAEKFKDLHPYNKFVIIALCLRSLIESELEGIGERAPNDT